MSRQDAENQSQLRPSTLAAQSVPFERHDALGPRVRVVLAALSGPAARYSKASCCLQYEIGPHQAALGKQPWRGYQLTFGPYFMRQGVNDEFSIGYAMLPNDANLDADTITAGSSQTYEYMIGFEFWQYKGSHHFIMDDLLGPYNDPARPRGSCTAADVCDAGDSPDVCAQKTS